MDGTLLEGSACLDLSVHAGYSDVIHDIEARWTVGEVGHVEFYELCLPLWEKLTDADIDKVFDGGRWVGGLEDVFGDIRRRGEHSAVITLSPQFFANRLRRFGVESVHGAEVLAGGNVDPDSVLTPESKVAIATDLLDRHGLDPDAPDAGPSGETANRCAEKRSRLKVRACSA